MSAPLSFRLGFSVAERIDNMLAQAKHCGLRVRQVKVSKREYETLPGWCSLCGRYRGIPLRLVGRDVWV
jgi:hypothetical protein